MVFKRRDRRAFWRRCVSFVLPERGYTRGWKYIGRRVQRIRDTPEKIALGFACGIFASFTPLFGCHFFIAAFLAWVLRANIVASLFGTIIGNPISFPLIAASSMGLGTAILGVGNANADGEGVIASFVEVSTLLWYGFVKGLGFTVESTVSWSVAKTRFGDFFDQVMAPYFIGGTIVGLVTAIVGYYLMRPAVAAYQKRRREKLAARARENVATRKKGERPKSIKRSKKAPVS